MHMLCCGYVVNVLLFSINLHMHSCNHRFAMPNKCCVPDCSSNYLTDHRQYKIVFKFSKEADLKAKWTASIPIHSVVCAAHFNDRHIIKSHLVKG